MIAAQVDHATECEEGTKKNKPMDDQTQASDKLVQEVRKPITNPADYQNDAQQPRKKLSQENCRGRESTKLDAFHDGRLQSPVLVRQLLRRATVFRCSFAVNSACRL